MVTLIVDDHVLFASALRQFLEANGLEVIGTAKDGIEAVEQVRALHPDVVLMDTDMPRCDGYEATRRIKAEFPDVSIVILAESDDKGDLTDAMRSGASGYITKDTQPRDFLELLAGVTRGEVAISNKAVNRLMDAFSRAELRTPPKKLHGSDHELSERQIEVLRMIATGYTYKEIASRLVVSERTVSYHVTEVLAKLKLQNRAQAIAYATRHGIIGPGAADA